MRTHSVGPNRLAALLAADDPTPHYVEDLLADIRSDPDLYYPDHVAACRMRRMLPLSPQAWRSMCLSR